MITKAEFKELLNIGKHWVKTHPKATFIYGFIVFTFVSFFVFLVNPILKLGTQIIDGDIPNTITYNQLTGLVLVMAAAIMFLLTLVWIRFLLRIGNKQRCSSLRHFWQNHSGRSQVE